MEQDEYARIAAAQSTHWWYRATAALIGDLIPPGLGADLAILDLGCGPGANLATLAGRGTVTGLDRAPEALGALQDLHPGVPAVRGDAAALPFPTAAFDVVAISTVLYTVASPARVLGEVSRVLRPGGVLVVVEPAFPALRRAHDRQVHGRRRFRRGELDVLVRTAGLDVTRSTFASSFLVPPAAVLALWERVRSATSAPAGPTSTATTSIRCSSG
ncbi:class I SAM-dependent methyltransferase [Aquihabitans daechungensis]|uniref:class I SAM-dependent methyltransferase n=1 Tax=Aquihabitans daechungensis TaxID=1052257 RepID=UPI003BA39BE2